MICAHDIDTLARTVWGEARGEPLAGKTAVAHVPINRMKQQHWSGCPTVAETCRLVAQFSCWGWSDPNRPKLEAVTLDDEVFQECMFAALAVALGYEVDPTAGATHYHTRDVKPKWAAGQTPCAEIGAHLFYRGIK